MQNTTNLNLKKPDYTDFADIQDINDNMDTIDAELAAPTGDSANSTTTFTCSDVADGGASSWTTVPALTSGETHKSLFAKMSQMFKNIRYLYKLLGTTDISSIGNGTVTGGLSSLNDSLTNALANTPMNTEVIITNASALTQNALKTLRTGAYIVQCDNAPSSFPVSNAYGILFHLGSLLNYSAFIFLGGGNVWDSFYSYTDDTWVAWRSLRTMYVDVNVTVTSGGAAQLNSASGGVLSYEKFIYGYVIDSNSLNARFHTYSNLLYVKLYTDTGVAAPAGTYKIRCWYRP